VKRSLKTGGVLLFLILLVSLFIRLVLFSLETKGPSENPNQTIRKVEDEVKAATKQDVDRFKQASEEGQPEPPPQPPSE
jgi:apolipoprotein N-acyltransferase